MKNSSLWDINKYVKAWVSQELSPDFAGPSFGGLCHDREDDEQTGVKLFR
jgi:hypothetical protein